MSKRFAIALVTLSVCFAATACNTMKGAGRDIEKGGEKLQDASDSAKK